MRTLLNITDPFDRMIIAQAITENLPIITGDLEFRKYPSPVIC